MKFILEGTGYAVFTENEHLLGIVVKYFVNLDRTGERWSAGDGRGNWTDGFKTRKAAAKALAA